MVTIYSSKKIRMDNKTRCFQVELRGLSTDTKPTKIDNVDIGNGSVFIEIDTQAIYFYDLTNKEWQGLES